MTLISFERSDYSKSDARENMRSENWKKKKDIEVL